MLVSLFLSMTRQQMTLRGYEMSEEDLQVLTDAGLIEGDEHLRWFSSSGMFSIADEGSFFTDRRVVSYETINGELHRTSVEYAEIDDITVKEPGTVLDFTLISVTPFHSMGFSIALS